MNIKCISSAVKAAYSRPRGPHSNLRRAKLFYIFYKKAAMVGSKMTVFFYIFFTKRWWQGPSLPVLVLKPAVIASITVGCSNRHRRTNSLSVFKLKPTVMCRCSSHANSAPMTTTIGTLLPPTRQL